LILLALTLALPPVTQEEAVDFHLKGLCQMAQPGQGITRADGEGWIASSLPGKHIIDTGRSTEVLDLTPGKPVGIKVKPGFQVTWCPLYKPAGRTACGPVPRAFLYNATKVTD
jgi:hypothetical protein